MAITIKNNTSNPYLLRIDFKDDMGETLYTREPFFHPQTEITLGHISDFGGIDFILFSLFSLKDQTSLHKSAFATYNQDVGNAKLMDIGLSVETTSSGECCILSKVG